MKICKDTVVTLRYSVFDAQGVELEKAEHQVSYLHGGYDEIFPRVEEALNGKEVGERILLQLEPEEAFGEYDAEQLRVEPRERFPEPIQIGMQFEGVPNATEEGPEAAAIYTVTDVTDDHVVLDGNHPLAGIALRFNIEVINIRAAEPEEIALERALTDAMHSDHGNADDDEENQDLDRQIEERKGNPRKLH